MNYVGIDPGVHGGLVLISQYLEEPIVLDKMPPCEVGILRWMRANVTHREEQGQEVRVGIEWIPTAIYGVDKSSCSKLYGSYCLIRGILLGLGIAYVKVKPKRWQGQFRIKGRHKGESTSAWKGRLKAKAQEIFPSHPRERITLATADALLIAEYLRRKETRGKPC